MNKKIEDMKKMNTEDIIHLYSQGYKLSPSTNYIISKDGAVINAKNGLTGKIDFTGTDISAILTSINSSISGGEIIVIKEGIYAPSSRVTFTKSIKIKGEGNVIFNWNLTGQWLFIFNGSELSTTTIIADVTVGANTIVVTSVGSATSGDLLLIYDDTIWNPVVFPTWKTGELHEISSIFGNTFTINDTTINAFATAKNGSVKLIRPITVTVDGIAINGADRYGNYKGMQLNYNKDSTIRNCTLQNIGVQASEALNSYKTTLENNVIGNSEHTGGLGYGIGVADASAFTIVINNHIYNCGGHCVTLGGYGAIGQSRDTVVIANTLAQTGQTAVILDAHAIAESYYIYNNTIYCPSGNAAISSGAKITRISGNTIIGGYGISPRGLYTGSIVEIIGNIFKDTKYVYSTEIDATYKLKISNNLHTGNIFALVDTRTCSFEITNNQFHNTLTTDGGNGAIFIATNILDGIISNNIIDGAYLNGIQLYARSGYTISNVLVSGNAISNWNSSNNATAAGISIYDTTYCTVTDNILIRRSDTNTKGIREININTASDYNRIYNNDLRNVGTIVANRISVIGTNTKIWKNVGYLTENSGSSTGTGIQQSIPHGLAVIPTKIRLTNKSATANAYVSAVADGRNIYIIAVMNQAYLWEAGIE